MFSVLMQSVKASSPGLLMSLTEWSCKVAPLCCAVLCCVLLLLYPAPSVRGLAESYSTTTAVLQQQCVCCVYCCVLCARTTESASNKGGFVQESGAFQKRVQQQSTDLSYLVLPG